MFHSARLLAALAALAAFVAIDAANGTPLISEVFYDATGSDSGKVFVELYAAPGTSLAGLRLEAINGENGDTHAVADLSGRVGPTGFFVVADTRGDGSTELANADLALEFDPQNGPDSVRLVDASGVLDAVGFGRFTAGSFFAGEGSPAPDASGGESLARLFANLDRDDNALDFAVAAPTPGAGPTVVPEPGSAFLAAIGLAGLACWRRRFSRAPGAAYESTSACWFSRKRSLASS